MTGLAYAQNYQPSHIMIVDADDCVNKRLAEFVEKNPNKNGWFINKGYLYTEGNKFLFKREIILIIGAELLIFSELIYIVFPKT